MSIWVKDNPRYPYKPNIPLTILVNPVELVAQETFQNYEGCLSVPNLRGEVPRSVHVRVRGVGPAGKDLDFEVKGLTAGTFQHEVDHLYGKLFVDRVDGHADARDVERFPEIPDGGVRRAREGAGREVRRVGGAQRQGCRPDTPPDLGAMFASLTGRPRPRALPSALPPLRGEELLAEVDGAFARREKRARRSHRESSSFVAECDAVGIDAHGPALLRLQRDGIDLEHGAASAVVALAHEVRAPVLRDADDVRQRARRRWSNGAALLDLCGAVEPRRSEAVGRLRRNEDRLAVRRTPASSRARRRRIARSAKNSRFFAIEDAHVLALRGRATTACASSGESVTEYGP